MVVFRDWGFTDDGKRMYAYASVNRGAEVYAMRDLDTEEMRVKGSISDSDRYDLAKAFSNILVKYERGKATPGKEVAVVWG